MYARTALRDLAEVTASQWGMVTSAQAVAHGVSHLTLSRLTGSGDFIRVAHGVYKNACAPSDEHEALRAAWLAIEPDRFAWERTAERPGFAVVSGESAAQLHGIGNLRAMRSEFTTPVRKQTQRLDVRYRTRTLTSDDVTIRAGLPVTTVERTIADLVEARVQLGHIGDALRDAARQSRLDTDRLIELLAPLAERNGHPKRDGQALLAQLREAAGIDIASLVRRIAAVPNLSALVAGRYLASLELPDDLTLGAVRSLLESAASSAARDATADHLTEVLNITEWAS
ncbi:MAG: type IV toxin-antitoxin system AbiEi family antitoxin domain-containing protein [Propioniciclava sp.]|uniref:type IV toxin-antitoxin system AbiEi family antitoxin domain-containing protein n=1 Tax=Propioniciclava sp. TaxID=2038686 RepID=UPI0039E63E75